MYKKAWKIPDDETVMMPSVTYQLAGSLFDFKFQEMEPVKTGLYWSWQITVKLVKQRVCWFQIVKNKDWKQALYPKEKDADSGKAEMAGPDDKGHGLNFQLLGKVGASY